VLQCVVLHDIRFVYVCLSFCLKVTSFVGLLPILAARHIFIFVYLCNCTIGE